MSVLLHWYYETSMSDGGGGDKVDNQDLIKYTYTFDFAMVDLRIRNQP